jgi:aminoglycoside phosphotransferase family enzyme/predicted kinase
MAPGSSARLVAAMCDPGFYPHAPSEVELRETRISWVFLAGERVYKVKKPVVLPFLDYVSLERREAMCQEELRLNRRLAPDAYLGVRAIRRSGSALALDAADGGEIVEWAVEMRRLPEERTAARLLREGRLESGHLRALARRLAEFHRRAVPVPPAEAGPAAVGEMVRENLRELTRLAGEVVDRSRLRAAARFATAWLDANEARHAERSRRGRFREGHGDLRLEHVVFEDGIVVFDCVEFDPALRRIDVAADLAFLVMELHEAGAADLAGELVSAYREAGGDPGRNGLLSFYAAYRALVRAKLHYLEARELPERSPGRERACSAGDRLLALSERFAWRTRLPLVLVICGVSGSGKTTLARVLAEASALPHLSSDMVRKRLTGLAPHERAPASSYGDELSARTYAELGAAAGAALRQSGGALVDATFRCGRDRRAFREALGPGCDRVLFVECRAPRRVLVARADERAGRPGSVSDATAEVVQRQLRELEPLDDATAAGHVVLRTDRPLGEVVDDLLGVLDRRLSMSGSGPAAPAHHAAGIGAKPEAGE